MCGALSDPPYKGQVAGSFMWLNLLVCLYVCIVSVQYLFLFLKSHVWHGPEFVTELGMSKGLCIRLLCVRVRLYCTRSDLGTALRVEY